MNHSEDKGKIDSEWNDEGKTPARWKETGLRDGTNQRKVKRNVSVLTEETEVQ